MTIDNHSGREHQFGACPASPAEAHSRIALEQSALFAARLAIARWANPTAAPRLAQAEWYTQSQQNLQQWLARGGFTQYPDDCANLMAPTMYSLGAAEPQSARSDIPSGAA